MNGALRKVAWRLIPFMSLLYFVAFLDRVNIGFAALTMNADLGLTKAMYGFASGIFFIGYVLFLLQPGATEEWQRAEKVYDAMIDRALRVGGTCTGEHGIGQGKRSKLVAEYGADVVELMRSIKSAWDPQGILNPGKIFL